MIALMAIVSVVIAYAGSPATPNQWVALATGDTVEILGSQANAGVEVDPRTRTTTTSRALIVNYRSDLKDSARDRENAGALAQLVCRMADSLGLARIDIQPTRGSFFDLVSLSLHYQFEVRSSSPCEIMQVTDASPDTTARE